MVHDIFPILNKVVAEEEEPEAVTKGGIFIPESAQKNVHVGIVRATGPDVDSKQIDLGDKIMWGEYSGTRFRLDGIQYTVMLMKDILFVIRKKPDITKIIEGDNEP